MSLLEGSLGKAYCVHEERPLGGGRQAGLQWLFLAGFSFCLSIESGSNEIGSSSERASGNANNTHIHAWLRKGEASRRGFNGVRRRYLPKFRLLGPLVSLLFFYVYVTCVVYPSAPLCCRLCLCWSCRNNVGEERALCKVDGEKRERGWLSLIRMDEVAK